MVKVAFSIALLAVIGLLVFASRPDVTSVAEIPEPTPAKPSNDAAPPPVDGAGGGPNLSVMTAALIPAIPREGTPEQLFAATCAACHGAQGEGNADLKAPSIAGLPEWFSTVQFEKFRNGQRGEGEGDVGGHHMKMIAEAIPEERLPGLGEYIASLPIVPTTNTLGGDAKVGKELFLEHCAGCHRYNAHGEKAFRSAP